MNHFPKTGKALLVWLGLSLCSASFAANTPSGKKRFIVRYKKGFSSTKGRGGVSDPKQIFKISDNQVDQFLQTQKSDPFVETVEEDILMQAVLEPGDLVGSTRDSIYDAQWQYHDPSGGMNLPEAWNLSTGSESIVVAVLDTGILTNHPDLSGRLLPGADMVSDPTMGNDGNGRDMDPSDPGDWIELGDFCYQGLSQNSTWHGSHVAGSVAANSGNGMGVAGVNWKAKILPVRVLGKCGGFMSDIADGIRWAAGGSVSGVNDNPFPAKVINLSLGGFGSCTSTIQNAIDFANSRGSVVVVAAGNNGVDMGVTPFVPATCRGVISVGASNKFGSQTSYSNYGPHVDVTAPGGDSWSSIMSLGDSGSKSPVSPSYVGMSGTSMAAPHVAGVASLILSMNPGLYPAQVEDALKQTTRDIFCSSGECGTGLVDAFAALDYGKDLLPDSSFEGEEPISTPPTSTPEFFQAVDDDGGACGTIDLNNRDGGGGNGFALSLILGFFALLLIPTRKGKML